MSVVGIVPAGGRGERLGADRPKAFVVLAGKPLLDWSVQALGAVCDSIVIAAPGGRRSVASAGCPVEVVAGGRSRSASVRNAVAAAPAAEVFVVHDAARPLVTPELVRRCLDALVEGVDGVVAAAAMSDTVKEADSERRVLRTLDRSVLWSIQTPQVFRADSLRRALDRDEHALAAASDDASLVEQLGGTVLVVDSPRENLKVTHPADLRMAEALLC